MFYENTTYQTFNSDFQRRDTRAKILSFSELEQGWHFGDGSPLNNVIIQKALDLLDLLISSGFGRTNAFPGTNGDLIVTAYFWDYYLEFTIESNEALSFILEENDNELEYEEGLPFNDGSRLINSFWEKIWNAFGSSNTYTGTATLTDSKAVHSRILALLEESPSFPDLVYAKRETQYVLT